MKCRVSYMTCGLSSRNVPYGFTFDQNSAVRPRRFSSVSFVARVVAGATGLGLPVAEVVIEIGSGLNGKRRKLHRVLSDPAVGMIVVEHPNMTPGGRAAFGGGRSRSAAPGSAVLRRSRGSTRPVPPRRSGRRRPSCANRRSGSLSPGASLARCFSMFLRFLPSP